MLTVGSTAAMQMQRSLAPLARNLHVLIDAHHVTRGRGGEGLGDANEEYARMQEALVDAEAVIAFGGPKNLDADQPAQ